MTGKQILGYVTLTLHSHLPYVINHGTWPHGLEWLHEAAAETYLPLLRVMDDLEKLGTPLKVNLNLTPVLLEQLAHPKFKKEFSSYLQRKMDSARKDQEAFRSKGDTHLQRVAEFWEDFYRQSQAQFDGLGHDLIRGFKRFYDAGSIEIITCGATHGYFPLLGTDASIRAQVRLGVATHRKFFGRNPRGIWLPECGYRPAGEWHFPVPPAGRGAKSRNGAVQRVGVEEILAENGIKYFFVDASLLQHSVAFSPYNLGMENSNVPPQKKESRPGDTPAASLYYPHYAGHPKPQNNVAFFTRDPRTAAQVWSGKQGYPGDSSYLEFHKKHWPGGLRYWKVTDQQSDLGSKLPYYPDEARERTAEHARHFIQLAREALTSAVVKQETPPILTAPFDSELFGHWWFEGPQWLKDLAMQLAEPECPLELILCGDYLDRYPPTSFLTLPEGSWGQNGSNEVWLNNDTAWTWEHIYKAELAVQNIASSDLWRHDDNARKLANQICRELLLLESSDWQFLITTQSARDYAELRFNTHLDQFRGLLKAWKTFEASHKINVQAASYLAQVEERDSVFPSAGPELYV